MNQLMVCLALRAGCLYPNFSIVNGLACPAELPRVSSTLSSSSALIIYHFASIMTVHLIVRLLWEMVQPAVMIKSRMLISHGCFGFFKFPFWEIIIGKKTWKEHEYCIFILLWFFFSIYFSIMYSSADRTNVYYFLLHFWQNS